MDTLGISEEERSEIFSILAAILLLTPNTDQMYNSVLKQEREKKAAFNMGIPPASVGTLLASYDEVKNVLETRRDDLGAFVVVVCCVVAVYSNLLSAVVVGCCGGGGGVCCGWWLGDG